MTSYTRGGHSTNKVIKTGRFDQKMEEATQYVIAVLIGIRQSNGTIKLFTN